ncbi:MAG: hypothetical protein ACI4T9_05555, partial [Prevotella sp.]
MSYFTHHSIPSRPPLPNSSRCDGWHGRWLSYLLLLMCCFATTSVMAKSYSTTIKAQDIKDLGNFTLNGTNYTMWWSGAMSITNTAIKSNRIFYFRSNCDFNVKSTEERYRIREIVFEDTEGNSDYKDDASKRVTIVNTARNWGAYSCKYEKDTGSQPDNNNIRIYNYDAPSSEIYLNATSGKQFKFRRLTVVIVDYHNDWLNDDAFKSQSIGDTRSIKDFFKEASYYTDQPIHVTCSDPSAIKVANDQVTFLKAGDFTLTITGDANEDWAKSEVTKDIHVNKLNINPRLGYSSLSMKVWEAKELPFLTNSLPSDYDKNLVKYESNDFTLNGNKIYYKKGTALNKDFTINITCPATDKYNGTTKSFTVRADNSITSKDDWNSFANNVNAGTVVNADVVLTQDVTLDTNSPMVGYDKYHYSGTFDGGNHTLTFDFRSPNQASAPFHIVEGATIKNLKTAGKVRLTGPKAENQYHASGLVGAAYGVTIDNCEVATEIMFSQGGDMHSGGFVGHAQNSTVNITNCKFSGRFSAPSSQVSGIAGIVGWGAKTANVSHCYVAGSYSYVNGFHPLIYKAAGDQVGGTSTNNFYYVNGVNVVTNQSLLAGNITQATAEQVKSGEVTWGLQGTQTTPYWGQDAGDANGPQLNKTAKHVYRVAFTEGNNVIVARFANNGQKITWPTIQDLLGDKYDQTHNTSFTTTGNFTANSTVSADVVVPTTITNIDAYTIASLDNWKAFAAYTKTNPKVSAKLTANVSGITAADIVENYQGKFDGGGKTLTVNINGTGDNLSLFKTAKGATISDLTVAGTIVNSSTANGKFAAGFIGSVQNGDSTRLTRCVSNVTLTSNAGGDRTNGGLIGVADGPVVINDCAFTGKMIAANGGYSCAGLVGWSGNKTKISNSLVSAEFQFTAGTDNYSFARNPNNVTLTNCYYVNTFGTANNGSEQVSAEQLKNGDVAWHLQANRKNMVWGQTINGSQTAALTTDATKRVWQVLFQKDGKGVAAKYANDGKGYGAYPALKEFNGLNPHHYYTYSFSGTTPQTAIKQNTTVKVSMAENEYLAIANKNDWQTFCDYIKNASTSVDAQLTADVALDASSPMAGDDSHRYSGVFNGDGKTLTVAYNGTAQCTAPFMAVEKATIKNLKTAGTVSQTGASGSAQYHASGLVGAAHGVTIDNCEVATAISFTHTGDQHSGGFIGHAEGDTVSINNCKFSGSFIGNNGNVGGIAGLIGWSAGGSAITNCFVGGTYNKITGLHPLAYTIVKDQKPGTFKNNYFCAAVDTAKTDNYGLSIAVTAEQARNGEVAYLLQGDQQTQVWGQNLQSDATPQLSAKALHVNKVDFYNDANKIATRYASTGQGIYGSLPTEEQLFGNVTSEHHQRSYAFANDFSASTVVNEDKRIDINISNELLEISTAEDWKTFCNIINSYNVRCNGKLLNDISLTGDNAVMAGTDARRFMGSFDGNGKTLTVAYTGTGQGTAPFAVVEGCKISNLKTAGTIEQTGTEGDNPQAHASGMVGLAYGVTINNCESAVAISFTQDGDKYSGGFVGNAENKDVVLNNCKFSGKFVGKNGYIWGVAGLVGWAAKRATFNHCYVGGSYEKINEMHPLMYTNANDNPVVDGADNYYCLPSFTTATNSFGSATKVDEATLASGTVAYALQGGQGTPFWGQRLGTDAEPLLSDTAAVVHKVDFAYDGAVRGTRYANHGKPFYGTMPVTESDYDGANKHHYYALTIEGGFDIMNVISQDTTVNIAFKEQDYLPVASAQDWDKLCDLVSKGKNLVDAKMTSNVSIDDNNKKLGDDTHRYGGNFDGGGKTLTVALVGTGQATAPFAVVENAAISNLKTAGTIEQTGTTGDFPQSHASGLVGRAFGVTINNCESAVNISFTQDGDQHSGGFIGHAQGGTVVMNNCKFSGTFTGKNGTITGVAGLVGWSAKNATFNHCYVGGTYNNVSEVRPLMYTDAGDRPTVSGSDNYYCVSPNVASNGNYGSATRVDEATLATGSVTYALQEGQATQYWGQGLGTDMEPQLSDTVPVVHKVDFTFEGNVKETRYASHGKPFYGTMPEIGGEYDGPNKHHYYAVALTGDFDAKDVISQDTTVTIGFKEYDYLSIASAQDWDKLCNLVSRGRNLVDAKMTDNISIDDTNRKLGDDAHKYGGNFDGDGKTLSVAFTGTGQATAPFYVVDNAVIINLKTAGTIKQTGTSGSFPQSHASGLVGRSFGVTINNCESAVTISFTQGGDQHSGGFIGHAQGDTVVIRNSKFSGKFVGTNGNVNGIGGLIGWSAKHATIDHCYVGGSYENISEIHPLMYTDAGDKPTVDGADNYYCVSPTEAASNSYGEATKVTQEAAGNGSIAYALQKGQTTQYWGQDLGTDADPQLSASAPAVHKVNFAYNNKELAFYTYASHGKPVYGKIPNDFGGVADGQNKHHYYYASLPEDFDATLTIMKDTTLAVTGIKEKDYMPIASADDWNAFCTLINEGRNFLDAKMTDNVTLDQNAKKAGEKLNYSGVFDGQGKTLTVDYIGTAQATAPFYSVDNAIIRNLKTAGSIQQTGANKGAQYHASGMIGISRGVTIENSESAVAISFTQKGDQHSGGFIGHAQGDTVVMKNCKFSGTFSGKNGAISGIAGLVGWSAKRATFSNCYVGGTYENVSDIHPLLYTVEKDKPTVDGSANYYCVTPTDAASNSFGTATRLSKEEVNLGAAAYNLQYGQTTLCWGQTLGTDTEPQLTSDSAKVLCRVAYLYNKNPWTNRYANKGQKIYGGLPTLSAKDMLGDAYNAHHYYQVTSEEGITASTIINSDLEVNATLKDQEYYPVKSADDLAAFASIVKG